MQPLLSVENLKIAFHTYAGTVHAVNDVSFTLDKGEIIGIVGESGCGKSVTASAIMGLVPSPPGNITGGRIMFENQDIVSMDKNTLRTLRGNAISMVFQDPMTSLNPVLTIGDQIAETYMQHQNITKKAALELSIDMLRTVGIPSPETRVSQYPHQLSGGMRQRVMIAMALSCNPRILIADEPTTALDVTVQAQIIDLMKDLNNQFSTSIILITHDLGLVAGLCSRVLVMYAGKVVESASVNDLYALPSHPYTWGLLQSVPRLDHTKKHLPSIPGQPPDLLAPPTGCAFMPRCRFAMEICSQTPPAIEKTPGHQCRCWLHHEQSPYDPVALFNEEGQAV